jgi:hypothetical protein
LFLKGEASFFVSLLWGGWARPKITAQRKRRGSLTNPRRSPSSLALLHHVGREMLDKLLGIALKDVVDGKGKRLGINVRSVLDVKLGGSLAQC